MTNEAKAAELIGCNPMGCKSQCVNFCQRKYNGSYMCAEKDRLVKMAKWKDAQHNEFKQDILSLVSLIHATEENQSVIDDIKKLLQ